MFMDFENDTDGMGLMAAYVAGLIKGGVCFKIEQRTGLTRVTLTGGF